MRGPVIKMTGEQQMTQQKESGFTIVEIAIVLLIFGFIVIAVLSTLGFYNEALKHDRTIDSMNSIQSTLFDHLALLESLPCPANPNLDENDPNYGIADCGAGWMLAPILGRDVDNADGDNNPATGGENILIGAFPFQTLLNNDLGVEASEKIKALSGRSSLDGWNHKITYAVTQNLTNPLTYTENGGAIEVLDEFNNTVLEKPGIAHYILISHGENGRGSYTANGNSVDNCLNSMSNPNLVIINGNENENCDENDGIFLSALKSDVGNGVDNVSYDDIVRFQVGHNPPLWKNSGKIKNDNGTPLDPTDDYDMQLITNTNPGNIGIGVETPLEKLHVDGEIQAQKVLAEKLCGVNYVADSFGNLVPEDCMPAEAIAGELPNMKCSNPGDVVVSIEENKVHCGPAFAATVFTPCPAGQFMNGISSKHGTICITP